MDQPGAVKAEDPVPGRVFTPCDFAKNIREFPEGLKSDEAFYAALNRSIDNHPEFGQPFHPANVAAVRPTKPEGLVRRERIDGSGSEFDE